MAQVKGPAENLGGGSVPVRPLGRARAQSDCTVVIGTMTPNGIDNGEKGGKFNDVCVISEVGIFYNDKKSALT